MTPEDRATVFVIDDDARMRTALERLLKSVGLTELATTVLGQAVRTLLGDGTTALVRSSSRNARPWVMKRRGT